MTARLSLEREAETCAWDQLVDLVVDLAHAADVLTDPRGGAEEKAQEEAHAAISAKLDAARAEVESPLLAELVAVRAERDEAALLRDFYRLHMVQLLNQRGEAEVANKAWELGQITAEEALRRTDAAIQSHKAVPLNAFRAQREVT
ncbi:hypothetical protein [Streptomyces sp. N35]|uniref:hypothetical protein n=1 Tax=Streptomyces sp. N35 TaxID=2795730 RepID=UPI0018F2A908|nr:hypothetical protein [Streptomyces sp. N35]